MFSWFGKVSFVPYSKVSDFAVHLKDGRLMGTHCKDCGYTTFPPRADCPECMSGNYEFREYSGKGSVYTFTTIAAAPTGFDDMAPYTVAAPLSMDAVVKSPVSLKKGGNSIERLSIVALTIFSSPAVKFTRMVCPARVSV